MSSDNVKLSNPATPPYLLPLVCGSSHKGPKFRISLVIKLTFLFHSESIHADYLKEIKLINLFIIETDFLISYNE